MQQTTEVLIQSLPLSLRECSRPLASRAEAQRGGFVLYWMHHAVRDHENPALDVALTLGNQRQLPVVVYPGLGGRHPYNNDRHHSFILQGARDPHAELRPNLLDDESPARSRTGDELWDLAQTSLRIHGELHNNVRMTRAKAIPFWRTTPQAALRLQVAG